MIVNSSTLMVDPFYRPVEILCCSGVGTYVNNLLILNNVPTLLSNVAILRTNAWGCSPSGSEFPVNFNWEWRFSTQFLSLYIHSLLSLRPQKRRKSITSLICLCGLTFGFEISC